MKKLGILTFHGMGKQKRTYHEKLIKKIEEELGSAVLDMIHVESVYYHGAMQSNQESMWERMKEGRDLDATYFRKKMLYSFSDAANIQDYRDDAGMGRYATSCVRASVNTLLGNLTDTAPIVAVAQSLGNQVLSNYIWDAQKGRGIFETDPASDPEKLERLRVWFSTGNNMPLFVSGKQESDIKPIALPNPKFEWLNFYDRDDALGWPMAPVCSGYRDQLKVKDFEIHTGLNMLTAHSAYWTDEDFVAPLCEKLQELLSAA